MYLVTVVLLVLLFVFKASGKNLVKLLILGSNYNLKVRSSIRVVGIPSLGGWGFPLTTV